MSAGVGWIFRPQLPSARLSSSPKRGREEEDTVAEEPSKKKPKVKLRRRECTTCFVEVPINRFPKLRHGTERHGRDVCFECWIQHLSSEIEAKEWNSVSCAQCEEVLQEPEIKKLAHSRTYSLWLDKAARAYQANEGEFVACPSAKCGWGCFISTKEDGNIFTCQLCNFRYCVTCETLMHEGETCDAYKQRKQEQAGEDEADERLIGSTTKPCPNCPNRKIYKDGGCDHVTCLRCGHEFCWECSIPYNGPNGIRGPLNNHAHQQSCKHHPDRLPTYQATNFFD